MINWDLSHYKGTDRYSDGAVELELLEIVKRTSDFTEILSKSDSWAYLYHLTNIRENLLNWYDFTGKNLLEIGAGCGGCTGLFCDKLENVTTVELSKSRSEILYERHKNRSNLNLITGSIFDVKFETKFDYVTLIGVLEYASFFADCENADQVLLKLAKDNLSEDGKLIIAIENKFGLKYWNGAKEDHTSGFFDGLEGYQNTKARTYGKNELTRLLNDVGFKQVEFFYPQPDYKLPTQIFSEDLPISKFSPAFDVPNCDNSRHVFFNEELVSTELAKEGLSNHFANSFLIFAGK